MKGISLYIIEKLHLTKDIEIVKDDLDLIEKAKEVDSNKLKLHVIGIFSWPDKQDIQKMKEYKAKNSKPERLVNSIKNAEKLERRFIAAIDLKWEEAINVFGHALIDRNIVKEKDIIFYIAKTYLKGN